MDTKVMVMTCKVEGCDTKIRCKELCERHYRRWLRAGDYNIEEREYGYGNKKHPLYTTWQGMKDRCHNPNHSKYDSYGGRGIKVCTRWRDSFQAFLADMGNKPDGRTLDRIDNNRGYEPENCRWATYSKQALNRRMKITNTTGHTGISKDKYGKYIVRRHNAALGKREYLGYASTLEEAIKIYETPKSKLK